MIILEHQIQDIGSIHCNVHSSRRAWFSVLLPAVYKYITTGDYLTSYVEDDDIPDGGVRQMIAEVKNSLKYA